MDHSQILKRSWHNVWRYRALWLFGLLLAMTTTSWESALLFGDNNTYQAPSYQQELSQSDRAWLRENFDLDLRESYTLSGNEIGEFFRNEFVQLAVAIVILIVAVGILLMLLSLMIRYLSETALIKMVNDHEKTGEKCGLRQGLRMGWSRAAWRLFAIDLGLRLPALVVFVLLMLVLVAPIVALASTGTTAGIAGAVAVAGGYLLLIALFIVAAVLLEVLARLARQAAVVDGQGILQAIRSGYEVMRYQAKDVGLMWLILAGINLIWPLLMIPVVLVLLGIGIATAALVVGLVGGLGSLATAGAGAWITAGVIGGVLFLFIMIAPLTLLSGMKIVFESSAWTLTYRELRGARRVSVKSEVKPAAA